MAKKAFVPAEYAFIPEQMRQFVLRPTPLFRLLNPRTHAYELKSSPLLVFEGASLAFVSCSAVIIASTLIPFLHFFMWYV